MRSKTEKRQNANSKVEIKYFSIVEYDKEQEYLRRMHKSGWKLTRVSGICVYHFEKCEPEDVIYQLDYNQEGIEHKSEYLQLFADCGWEYLQDFAGYSYFRKPVAGMKCEEAIFCDDASRLDMMRRVFAGRFFPLLILMLLVFVPNCLPEMFQVEEARDYALICLFAFLMLIYALVFGTFAYKYFLLKERLGK